MPQAESELGMHPATAVGATGIGMDAADVVGQPRMLHCPNDGGRLRQHMEPGLGHLQHPAAHGDAQALTGHQRDSREPALGAPPR